MPDHKRSYIYVFSITPLIIRLGMCHRQSLFGDSGDGVSRIKNNVPPRFAFIVINDNHGFRGLPTTLLSKFIELLTRHHASRWLPRVGIFELFVPTRPLNSFSATPTTPSLFSCSTCWLSAQGCVSVINDNLCFGHYADMCPPLGLGIRFNKPHAPPHKS